MTQTQLEEVLRRAEQALDEKDATFIRGVFESYRYVTDLVEDKKTTIARLRHLLFGQRTEKTKAVVGSIEPEACGPGDTTPASAAMVEPSSVDKTPAGPEADPAAAGQGHGRNGAPISRTPVC
jgi:hypothetical protein